MIRLNVDSDSPLPVYQQLKQAIILEVLFMRLKVVTFCPLIGALAKW